MRRRAEREEGERGLAELAGAQQGRRPQRCGGPSVEARPRRTRSGVRMALAEPGRETKAGACFWPGPSLRRRRTRSGIWRTYPERLRRDASEASDSCRWRALASRAPSSVASTRVSGGTRGVIRRCVGRALARTTRAYWAMPAMPASDSRQALAMPSRITLRHTPSCETMITSPCLWSPRPCIYYGKNHFFLPVVFDGFYRKLFRVFRRKTGFISWSSRLPGKKKAGDRGAENRLRQGMK